MELLTKTYSLSLLPTIVKSFVCYDVIYIYICIHIDYIYIYMYNYIYILIVIHDNVIFWDFQSHRGSPKSLTFWVKGPPAGPRALASPIGVSQIGEAPNISDTDLFPFVARLEVCTA